MRIFLFFVLSLLGIYTVQATTFKQAVARFEMYDTVTKVTSSFEYEGEISAGTIPDHMHIEFKDDASLKLDFTIVKVRKIIPNMGHYEYEVIEDNSKFNGTLIWYFDHYIYDNKIEFFGEHPAMPDKFLYITIDFKLYDRIHIQN